MDFVCFTSHDVGEVMILLTASVWLTYEDVDEPLRGDNLAAVTSGESVMRQNSTEQNSFITILPESVSECVCESS